MKKYEKPKFETFKVKLSSGADKGCTGGSTNTQGNGQCRPGVAAAKQCFGGSAPDRKCHNGTGD